MELLKYVYFYAKKSIIIAGNDKFQDLINAPRMYLNVAVYMNDNVCKIHKYKKCKRLNV